MLIRKKCFYLAILLSFNFAFGDMITLEDDSVINGKITETSDGKFHINNAITGKVSVETGKVKSITTDADVYVAFEGGNTVFGRLVDERGTIKIRTSSGTLDAKNEKVLAIWHLGQRSPLLPLVESRNWKYEAAIDISGKTGNSEKVSTAANLKATLESVQDKLQLYLRGDRTKVEGERSADEIIAGIDYESRFNAPHSWYARTELETDRIEDIDIRATAGVGYGYYFVNEEWHELRGRFGIQLRHEAFDRNAIEDIENGPNGVPGGGDDVRVDDSETSFGLDFGLHHRWHINEWGKLVTDIVYTPSLENADDFRVFQETYLEMPLAKSKVWFFRIGAANEYNGQVVGDTDRLDTSYYSRLVLNWE